MTIDMSQFYQVFFEESAELLEEMERLLLELDVAEPGKDALNAIFRTAHSIKGGSATFGFNEITETTHVLESLLDKLRNDELRLRVDMVDVFLKAVDVIKMQLAGRQFASEVDAQAVAEICQRLGELAGGEAAPAAAAPDNHAPPPAARTTPKTNAAAVATPAPVANLVENPIEHDTAPVDPAPENLYAILTGAAPVAALPAAKPADPAEAYGFFNEIAPATTPIAKPPRSVSASRKSISLSIWWANW